MHRPMRCMSHFRSGNLAPWDTHQAAGSLSSGDSHRAAGMFFEYTDFASRPDKSLVVARWCPVNSRGDVPKASCCEVKDQAREKLTRVAAKVVGTFGIAVILNRLVHLEFMCFSVCTQVWFVCQQLIKRLHRDQSQIVFSFDVGNLQIDSVP